jgi:hypothetical protein
MGNNKNKDRHLGVIQGNVVERAKVANWQHFGEEKLTK